MNFIYILLSVLVLIFSLSLFKIAFGTMRISEYAPHMHLYYWQLGVMCLVGANLMILGVRPPIIVNFVDGNNTYVYSLLCVAYTMLMIPISIIVSKKIFNLFDNEDYKEFLGKRIIIIGDNKERVFFGIFTVMAVLVVIYLCYYNAPLFLYLTGQGDNVLLARIEYSRNFQGSAIIKNVIGQSIIPLISYITFIYYKSTSDKYWRNVFLVICFCSIFISGAEMSKAGVAFYFIPYIYLIVYTNNNIPIKQIFKYLLIILVPTITMYTVYYSNAGWGLKEIIFNFYGGPIGRILVGQIQALPAFLEIFPYENEYLYGKSISILKHLGLSFQEAGRIVASYIEPIGVREGWVGTSNTLFIGDAYANFGLIGIVLSPIYVGFVLSLFYGLMIKSKKTPVTVGFYLYCLNHLTISITSGFFSAYIINTRIIAAILFIIIFMLLTSSTKRLISSTL